MSSTAPFRRLAALFAAACLAMAAAADELEEWAGAPGRRAVQTQTRHQRHRQLPERPRLLAGRAEQDLIGMFLAYLALNASRGWQAA